MFLWRWRSFTQKLEDKKRQKMVKDIVKLTQSIILHPETLSRHPQIISKIPTKQPKMSHF